jgi:hypothetical protein
MRVALLLALATCCAAPCGAATGQACGSLLAITLVEGPSQPSLTLLQRSITRTWGLSEESTYVEVSVPDWKSEAWAMALSGVVPGAGHAYLGERSGLIFALLELAGWGARIHYGNRDEQLRNDAAVFRGNPEDSAAVWSFARWEKSTGGDPTGIRTLYEQDPDEFDVRIGRDPTYGAGWESTSPQSEFTHFLDEADGMLQRRKIASTGLWFNHLVAAFDALRTARIHNFPLRQDMQLKVKTSWRGGNAGVRATLERSF